MGQSETLFAQETTRSFESDILYLRSVLDTKIFNMEKHATNVATIYRRKGHNTTV